MKALSEVRTHMTQLVSLTLLLKPPAPPPPPTLQTKMRDRRERELYLPLNKS